MTKHVPIFDLVRLHQSIQKELDAAIAKVIRRGIFILGEEVTLFEKEFASYIGVPYAVGVASGTDALTLSLQAAGIGVGDEVILPANAYPTAFGVAKSGAHIRLVDVEEKTGLMNITQVKQAITKRTRAVIPVHLYGNPVNLLNSNALNSKLLILEDAAQAHGATIDGKKVGSFGDIGIFSFYPSKNLGALGDGGMIVTKKKSIAHTLTMLRMYGETGRYKSAVVSGVSRLDELQAAILRVKLRHLDAWNAMRNAIAQRYIEALDGVEGLTILRSSFESAHHLFVIRTKKRNALQRHLGVHGVGSAIHFPAPIHTQKAFVFLGYKKGNFPISENLCNEVLSLPLFPHMTKQEVSLVISTVQSFFTTRY